MGGKQKVIRHRYGIGSVSVESKNLDDLGAMLKEKVDALTKLVDDSAGIERVYYCHCQLIREVFFKGTPREPDHDTSSSASEI